MSPFCLGCRRPVERCLCYFETVTVSIPDPVFRAAAAQGFEPLNDAEREAFKEKAEVYLRVVQGGRG